MSQASRSTLKKLTALTLLAAAGALFSVKRAHPPLAQVARPDPVLPANKAAEPPRAALPEATREPSPASPSAVTAPPATNRALAEKWLETAANYEGSDRGERLDSLMSSVVNQGAVIVPELYAVMRATPVYKERARSAAFHVLGKIGAALTDSNDAAATGALAAIHDLAGQELALPAFVEPDPALHVEALSPTERGALLHLGVLEEHAGKLVQPTTQNKLAVVQMLTRIGDPEALDQLQALQARTDNAIGVTFAAADAIELVNHGEKPVEPAQQPGAAKPRKATL